MLIASRKRQSSQKIKCNNQEIKPTSSAKVRAKRLARILLETARTSARRTRSLPCPTAKTSTEWRATGDWATETLIRKYCQIETRKKREGLTRISRQLREGLIGNRATSWSTNTTLKWSRRAMRMSKLRLGLRIRGVRRTPAWLQRIRSHRSRKSSSGDRSSLEVVARLVELDIQPFASVRIDHCRQGTTRVKTSLQGQLAGIPTTTRVIRRALSNRNRWFRSHPRTHLVQIDRARLQMRWLRFLWT